MSLDGSLPRDHRRRPPLPSLGFAGGGPLLPGLVIGGIQLGSPLVGTFAQSGERLRVEAPAQSLECPVRSSGRRWPTLGREPPGKTTVLPAASSSCRGRLYRTCSTCSASTSTKPRAANPPNKASILSTATSSGCKTPPDGKHYRRPNPSVAAAPRRPQHRRTSAHPRRRRSPGTADRRAITGSFEHSDSRGRRSVQLAGERCEKVEIPGRPLCIRGTAAMRQRTPDRSLACTAVATRSEPAAHSSRVPRREGRQFRGAPPHRRRA